MGFSGSSDSKESTCKAGDPGSIPGSGRSPEEGIENTHLRFTGSQRVEHNLATDFHCLLVFWVFFFTYYKCFHLPLKDCLLPPIMLFMLT